MANIIASPTRYIQGKGEMEHLCQHASLIGQKLFVIITESGKMCIRDRHSTIIFPSKWMRDSANEKTESGDELLE